MYTSELIKISEAYTKQMYKAKVTESSVVESTQHVAECGKQCNESYEDFYVKLEKEPFNILEDDCWQCDELLTLVKNNDKEEEFNNLAKEMFMDNAPTLTEFNDWCRFDYDSICEHLGISDEEDDEDNDDEELDESGANTDADDIVAGINAEAAGTGNGGTAGTGNGGTPAEDQKGWLSSALNTASQSYEEIKDWAKKNPGLAMGVAAGVAGLGTALLARKRRRRG